MMKKRAISLLLALLLTLSLLPGNVVALRAEAEDAAADKPQSQSVVELGEKALTGWQEVDLSEYLLQFGGTKTLAAPAVQSSAAVREEFDNRVYKAVQSRIEEIDVSDLEMTPEEVSYRWRGLLKSHPELFYAGSSYSWFTGTRDGVEYVTLFRPTYRSDYDERDIALFNAVTREIVDYMPAGTDAEKMLYLHDYIATHCEYSLAEDLDNEDVYNAYNCLVDGIAVCKAYALAFLYLCQQAGLEASHSYSAELKHAWNIARPSGESLPYLVDCTWDDPKGRPVYICRHKHFLRSKSSFYDENECGHTSTDWADEYGDPIYDDLRTGSAYESSSNAWWRDLTRAVQWSGSTMGYARPEDFGHIYLRWSGEAEEKAVPIDDSDGEWTVWDAPGSVYTNSYVRVAALGGNFYYSTSRHIWRLEKDWSSTPVYTLTEAEQARGEIYELINDNGNLRYYLAQSPNEDATDSALLTFPPVLDYIYWNHTAVKTGEAILWVALASGGDGSLTYGFNVYKDGSFVGGSGTYVSDNIFSYTPTEGGTYSIEIFVRDGTGTVVSWSGSSITVTAVPVIDNIWADRSTATAGEAITWTISASGGTGSLEYGFEVYQDETRVGNSGGYGTSNTFIYTPADAGTYSVKVYVRDENGYVVSLSGGSVTVAAPDPPVIYNIWVDRFATTAGEPITWTVGASGGTGSLLYAFDLYKDETFVKQCGPYSDSNSLTYTPTEAGVYSVKVFVKDEAGRKVSQMSGSVSVIAADPPVIGSVWADRSTAAVGEAITWTATASGGGGSLSYGFKVYLDGEFLFKTDGFSASNSYTYAPTEPGTYKVTAYVRDNAGNEVHKSGGSVSVQGTASSVPGDIASVTVTPSAGGKITLSWSASANVKTYVLQRHERGSDVWTTLASNISGTTYTDTSGKTGKVYQYRVRGRNGSEFGDWKTSAEVACMSGSEPGSVDTPTVKPSSGGKITVSWKAAAGAATYILQRNERGSSAWVTLGSNIKETKYTDTSAKLGKVYRYRVRSRNVSVFGPFKVSVEVAAMKGSAPGTVGTPTVTAAKKKITVSWTAAEGAATYILQRKERGSDKWVTLNTNVKETSYVDTTGEVGAVYQYRVRSRNVSAYGPFKASTEVGFMAGSTPGDISKVTVKATSGKITVTWTASEGAAGYIVQRRVKGSDTWENLNTNVTALSYVDKTAKAGTTYQYRIRPRNGSIYGNFKASAEVTAK